MDYSKGIYTVNGRPFVDKLQAILYANQTLADIQWDFFGDIFKRVNWTEEPSFSLDDLYEMRAQQIRDKYDYVVLCCSGGADSTNALLSFLNNGIHVDEIVAGAPMSGLNNWDWSDKDKRSENNISETKYALFPLLDHIKTYFPKVKITLNDYFEDMVNYESDAWLLRSADYIQASASARFKYDKFSHLKNIAESGKKMCFVYGIDKPVILKKDDYFLSCIPDLPINFAIQPFEEHYNNVHNVLFYISPELPQLLVKQAHSLTRWLSLPTHKHYMDLVVDVNNPMPTKIRRARHATLERTICPCIYPSIPHDVFQTAKNPTLFLGEYDHWFFKLHANTRTHQMIMSDAKAFLKNISAKYFSDGDQKTEFSIMVNVYNLGHKNKFNQNPVA